MKTEKHIYQSDPVKESRMLSKARVINKEKTVGIPIPHGCIFITPAQAADENIWRGCEKTMV